MIDLNKITLGATAGAVTNVLIGGIGARAAMRIVALLIGAEPAVTVGGTAGILLLAGMLGTVVGLAVAYLHGWAGGHWRKADWVLGGLLAAFVAALFFLNREGESALLPAAQGALLFAPLALFSTAATGAAYEWLRRRYGATKRQAPAVWAAIYAVAFILAFMGMMSLAGNTLRLPRIVWQMASLASAGADLAGTYALVQLLGLLFALAYLLLTWLLFWLADSSELRAAAIGCLLLAAGLFHRTGPIEAVFGRGAASGVLEGLLALLGAAIVAVVYWRLLSGLRPGMRCTPLIAGLLAVVGVIGGVAGLIAVRPQWNVVSQPPLVTLFSVTVYLLPWLALPLGLLLSRRRQPVRVADTPVAPAAALAELS